MYNHYSWVEVMLVGTIVLLLSFVGYAAYQDSTSTKFELIKDQWTCTQTEEISYVTLVGKTPIINYNSQCVNYRRN